MNSLYKVLELKQNFWKNKIVPGEIPFFMVVPSCNPHYICLNIGFWQGSFLWICCIFNPHPFKAVLQFFEKDFSFSSSLSRWFNFAWNTYSLKIAPRTTLCRKTKKCLWKVNITCCTVSNVRKGFTLNRKRTGLLTEDSPLF